MIKTQRKEGVGAEVEKEIMQNLLVSNTLENLEVEVKKENLLILLQLIQSISKIKKKDKGCYRKD